MGDTYHAPGAVSYLDLKTGQRRIDDPRLAVSSHIGLSLVALRFVWNHFVDSTVGGFPFTDDEAWNLADQLGVSVLRMPRQSIRRSISESMLVGSTISSDDPRNMHVEAG